MKQYFRFFAIPFGLVGILAVVTLVMFLVNSGNTTAALGVSESTNTDRTTTERVFDYADKLTDTEEDLLRSQIQEAEEKTKCDIVLVTLNESLVEYAAQYEEQIGSVPISKCVMVYADNFYDEHMFGYDTAYGDGVLFLDNWYREADGYVYSWMSTCGRAEQRYSSSMIDDVMEDVLYYVEDDPYRGYSAYVQAVVDDMTGVSGGGAMIETALQPLYILLASVVIALVFLLVNWISKKGKRTTTNRTYVVGGIAHFRTRDDQFLYKNVTKRKIESSSGGGGGGGHHRSAGGRSHGGGGGRR